MGTPDTVERMRQLFERAWNEDDTDVVDEIVADDFTFERGGTTQEGGPDLYKDLIAVARETFPDMEYSLEEVIVGDGGDKVVLRWEMTGTHEGEYKGVAPTNQTVEMEGIEINRFEDGELVETQTHPNWVGFLEDIGALPFEETG
jgi:steroid delta-isomerase-like uncharacterized protein